MEEYSRLSVWELLSILQRKVRSNVNIIQKNLQSVDAIKKNYGDSKKRGKVVDAMYKQNNELAQENTKLLDLHNSLSKFHEKFQLYLQSELRNENSNKTVQEVDWKTYRKQCMERTITGDLKLNNVHPFIKDRQFLNELMSKCQDLELYERCSEIKRVKAY
jgi:hypothetical protein